MRGEAREKERTRGGDLIKTTAVKPNAAATRPCTTHLVVVWGGLVSMCVLEAAEPLLCCVPCYINCVPVMMVCDGVYVTACDGVYVMACDGVYVMACDSVYVMAGDSMYVMACDGKYVMAWDGM